MLRKYFGLPPKPKPAPPLFKCEKCKRGFISNSGLQTHLLTHSVIEKKKSEEPPKKKSKIAEMFENARRPIDPAPDVVVPLVDYDSEEDEEEAVVSSCAEPPKATTTQPVKRSRYTFKFKAEAIAARESGISEADVARECNVDPSLINRWYRDKDKILLRATSLRGGLKKSAGTGVVPVLGKRLKMI